MFISFKSEKECFSKMINLENNGKGGWLQPFYDEKLTSAIDDNADGMMYILQCTYVRQSYQIYI